ncbi:MAG: acyltransferase family protein, partial [Akkermansia sp.]
GITAIPSVLGTVLLIKFGANLWSKKILESRVFVGIGKISYSLYLWHWPIIVYWTYCTFGENNLIDYLGILILSFSIAYASWRFVETPIRKNKSYSPAITLSATLVICLIIGSISLFLFKSNFIKNYFYPRDNQYYAKIDYWKGEHYVNEKDSSPIKNKLIKLGDLSSNPTFLLMGDSHAMALSPGINQLAKEIGEVGLYYEDRVNVFFFIDAIQILLNNYKDINTYIISYKWSDEGFNCFGKTERLLSDDKMREYIDLLDKSLRATCKFLNKEGKQVILFTSIPEHKYETGDFYWRLSKCRLTKSNVYTNKTSIEKYCRQHNLILSVLRKIQEDHLAIVINSGSPFLEDGGYIDKKGDTLLYKDHHHLSPAGAVYLIDEVKDQIIPYLTKPDGR